MQKETWLLSTKERARFVLTVSSACFLIVVGLVQILWAHANQGSVYWGIGLIGVSLITIIYWIDGLQVSIRSTDLLLEARRARMEEKARQPVEKGEYKNIPFRRQSKGRKILISASYLVCVLLIVFSIAVLLGYFSASEAYLAQLHMSPLEDQVLTTIICGALACAFGLLIPMILKEVVVKDPAPEDWDEIVQRLIESVDDQE